MPNSSPQSRRFGCPVPFAMSDTRHRAKPSSIVFLSIRKNVCSFAECSVTTQPARSIVQEQ
jgi:hypothetical protein